MTFKDVIDEAFSPEFENWVNTKVQTATTEKNQIDLQQLQALQKEIAAQKILQQKQQQPVQKPVQQVQAPNVQQMQTATTAQLSAN